MLHCFVGGMREAQDCVRLGRKSCAFGGDAKIQPGHKEYAALHGANKVISGKFSSLRTTISLKVRYNTTCNHD